MYIIHITWTYWVIYIHIILQSSQNNWPTHQFCPKDFITREHSAKIIVRTLIGGVDGMQNYINTLKEKCVKNNEFDFSKNYNITRAETAYLIYKAKGNETCKVD